MNEVINSIKNIVKQDVIDKIKYRNKVINQAAWVILGNHKSGTTAIAKLISIATQKSLTSDFIRAIQRPSLPLEITFDILPFQDFLKIYKYEFSADIIKEPFLTFHAENLFQYLSKAKYLFVVRNPFENIRSILNRLRIPGNLEQVNMHEWKELRVSPAWKLSLQSQMLGIESSNYIEAMAIRWNFAVETYFKNSDRFILVKYEDFILDKNEYILNLCDKMNLEVLSDITNYLDVQFQPKGDKNIDLSSFFGEANSKLLYDVCKNNMTKLGY